MTEYVDVSTIKPGDEVKVDYLVDDTWYSIKGWHEVAPDEFGHQCAAGRILRRPDGAAATYTRVRAHRPAPEPVPTELGIAFVATVRGVPDVPVFVSDYDDDFRYITSRPIGGSRWHHAAHIADVRQVTRLGVEVDR